MEKSNEKKSRYSYKIRMSISIFLLIVSGALFGAAKYVSGFSDWYFENVYKDLVGTFCRWISVLPFSLYEIIIYIFIIFIVVRFFKKIKMLIKSDISFMDFIKQCLTNMIIYISIFVFLNVVTQGINCFKKDFISLTQLQMQEVSEDKLIELCELFKNKINELDTKIQKDEYGFLTLDKNAKKTGIDNMVKLGEKYNFLSGFYPNPKPYVFSKVMSYQLLQGETTFTMEANYNNDMMAYNIPSTICHELSHIKGFNNEYEANYISFLACINSESYEYQYSGYMMAYSYCMNDLYNVNKEAYERINNELSTSVKLEKREDVLYWKDYRGGVSDLYNKVYDKLLKAGGQEEGITSYNNVVKLIISGYGVQF